MLGREVHTNFCAVLVWEMQEPQKKTASVKKCSDYANASLWDYPFGLAMPGRSSNSANPNDDYKFTGYEKDDEAGLDLYHAGNRGYDPVLGRFMQIDRYYYKYPSMSTYQYAANNPVYFIDVNGDSIWVSVRTGFLGLGGKTRVRYEDGKLYNKDGSEYTGKVRGFLKRTRNALDDIREGGEAGGALISDLQSSDKHITIRKGDQNQAVGYMVSWDPNDRTGGIDENGNSSRPSFIGLAHELGHAHDALDGVMDRSTWVTFSNGDIRTKSEITATHWENRIRAENGIPLRAYYGVNLGTPVEEF